MTVKLYQELLKEDESNPMKNDYFRTVISPGDKASKYAKEIGFQSHDNNLSIHVVPNEPNNFRGPVGFIWRDHILSDMRKYKLNSAKTKVSHSNFLPLRSSRCSGLVFYSYFPYNDTITIWLLQIFLRL